jgi:hypothetical protein
VTRQVIDRVATGAEDAAANAVRLRAQSDRGEDSCCVAGFGSGSCGRRWWGVLLAATDWWTLRTEKIGFIEKSEGQWGQGMKRGAATDRGTDAKMECF